MSLLVLAIVLLILAAVLGLAVHPLFWFIILAAIFVFALSRRGGVT